MDKKRLPTSKRRAALRDRRKLEQQVQRNRLYITLGVIAVAVLIVAALIVYGLTQQPASTQSADNAEIVKITPKERPLASGKGIGPADSKVVVTEFADFQCPMCKVFHDNISQQIIDEYASQGKIRFEFKHFIIIDGNIGGTESRRAAEASECANGQGKFWDYYDTLYANQGAEGSGRFLDSRLKQYAVNVGLDTEKFNKCLDGRQYSQMVTLDDAMARSLNLNGTPSLLVNGKLVQNVMDWNTVKTAIDNAIKTAGQ